MSNPIFYKDLISPDSSISQLISQLTELIAKYGELKSKIQADAQVLSNSLKSVSSATEEQRTEIERVTRESDKLAAQYKNVTDEERLAYRASVELNQAKKEQQKIDKLIVQLNNSAEGSYNKLSAQYRLNKIRLNEMSEAQRKGTKAGRELEKETEALYEEMNKLQLATGKAQLQVGHYERGMLGAIGVSDRFVDIITDSTKRTEMFKGVIGALKKPLGATVGVIASGVAVFKLWRSTVDDTQITTDAWAHTMARLNARWDAFAKSVALMDFSGVIKNMAEAAAAGHNLALTLDEVFERTNSVELLKSAMSVENAMLEETAKNTALSYDERLDAAQKYIDNISSLYEQEEETARRVRDKQLDYLFTLTNRREFASEEEKKIAREEFAANIQNYNLNENLINQAFEYNKAIKARETLYNRQITSSQQAESLKRREAELDDIIEGTGKAAKAFSDFIDQYNLANDEQITAYVEAQVAYNNAQAALYNENKRIITLKNNIEAQREKEVKARADAEAKAVKEAEEKKQKAEKESAQNAQKALEEENKARLEALQMQVQTLNLQIAVAREGSDEMLQLRIAAINKQREIELEQNRQTAEKLRQDEALINAKYDAQISKTELDFYAELAMEKLSIQQEFEASEFDLLEKNERQKTQFQLEQEKKRLKEILRINRINGKELTDEQKETLQNQIAFIDKQSKSLPYDNLYEVLGIDIDSQKQEALNEAVDNALGFISDLIDGWEKAADARLKTAQAEIDSAKSALDAEIEARNNGYANNVIQAQKELELAKQTEEQALSEKKKAQKAQLALDSITQASSLITASANLWASLSPVSIVGPALAVAAIATMWGSFALSKAKAYQATSVEQYGEGTVELLQGGSHASGHDIDLGTKPDGTRRRAEGGEYFAVINRRNSRRFGAIIPDVINSLNNGTFADKYQRANSLMAGYTLMMGGAGSSTDVSSLERDVRDIRKQGSRSRFVDGDGNVVECYKNLRRKIIKS